MALVGHMLIDSMLPTIPFGFLVDTDSNHLPLAYNSYPWWVWLNKIKNDGLESATGMCACGSVSSFRSSPKWNMQAYLTFQAKVRIVKIDHYLQRCSKDMDMQFALIISRQVALTTKWFIIANYHYV